MNTIKHNMEVWFSEVLDSTNTTPMSWFESQFKNNRLGTFKAPRTVIKRFNDGNDLSKFFNALGQSYIELAIKMKPKLKMIPFSMLEKQDRENWREYVCEQIQHAVTNRQTFQIINASNISTSSFTMNVDTTPWAFTADMLSMHGRNLIQNTEIDLYDIVDENVLYTETHNGNVKVLRTIEMNNEVPSIVWDTI